MLSLILQTVFSMPLPQHPCLDTFLQLPSLLPTPPPLLYLGFYSLRAILSTCNAAYCWCWVLQVCRKICWCHMEKKQCQWRVNLVNLLGKGTSGGSPVSSEYSSGHFSIIYCIVPGGSGCKMISLHFHLLPISFSCLKTLFICAFLCN